MERQTKMKTEDSKENWFFFLSKYGAEILITQLIKHQVMLSSSPWKPKISFNVCTILWFWHSLSLLPTPKKIVMNSLCVIVWSITCLQYSITVEFPVRVLKTLDSVTFTLVVFCVLYFLFTLSEPFCNSYSSLVSRSFLGVLQKLEDLLSLYL